LSQDILTTNVKHIILTTSKNLCRRQLSDPTVKLKVLIN